MTDGAYDAFDDPYCYKGSFVLKNKAGLRDASALEGFELEMSAMRAEEPLPDGRFDPAHYCAVHAIFSRTSIAGPDAIALCGRPKTAAPFVIRNISSRK